MKNKTKILAGFITALLATATAHATITMTLEEVGTDVVLTGSGSANLTDLGAPAFSGAVFPIDAQVNPSEGNIIVGRGASSVAYNLPGAPTFGAGTNTQQNDPSSTGLAFGVGTSSGNPILVVPDGYVSGNNLTITTATFTNTDLAAMGADPGVYTWNWGSGPNADSLVLTVVPESSTYAALAGFLALGFVIWRRRKA